MIRLKKLLLYSIGMLFATSCSDTENKNPLAPRLTKSEVHYEDRRLAAWSAISDSDYLVVFESGLGNDHTPWTATEVAIDAASQIDVLLYDRAGYGDSPFDAGVRDIDQLTTELEAVINHFSDGRKVILVGHSLGGLIIRDYAIKHPGQTAALLFVDASHEMYNQITQEQEDYLYDLHLQEFGPDFGGTAEARQLIEDMQYMSALPNLPDVPVICVTSMKIDADHDAADRQLWYDSKEALRVGVTDFTQVTTVNSGHYIMLDEPGLVLEQLLALRNKLP